EKTHNGFIQVAFHGASGAVLAAQGKYEDAIGELLEDDRNPYTLRFLILAYQKTGAAAEANRWSARLNNVKNPTLEQLLATSSALSTQARLPETSKKEECMQCLRWENDEDRKRTRLNSSHQIITYD